MQAAPREEAGGRRPITDEGPVTGLHGDLFEFNQISSLRANDFFTNRAGGKVGHFVYNQFGGVLGGPVYIPKVYDARNKTFFFVHYERKNVPGTPQTEFDTVPTALERNDDFSQSLNPDGTPVTIYDPAAVHQDASGNWVREPFPTPIIPSNRWNPVAKTLIPFYPAPTSAGTGPTHLDNYFAQGTGTSSWYELEIKIDHNFTEKQRLSARYSRDHSIGQGPNLWGNCPSSAASLPYCGGGRGNFMYNGPSYGSDKHQNAVVDYTNTINPTTVLNLRWGISRENAPSGILGETGYFNEHDVGFQNTVSMQIQRAPSIGVQNFSDLGPSIWTGTVNANDVNDFIGNLTKGRGRHTFKMGAGAAHGGAGGTASFMVLAAPRTPASWETGLSSAHPGSLLRTTSTKPVRLLILFRTGSSKRLALHSA